MTRASALPALTALLLAPCAAADALWVTIGESLTSHDGPAEVAYRMFSAPDAAEQCARPQPVALRGPGRLVVRAGEPLPYAALQFVALDARGEALDGVTLSVELEETDPGRFSSEAMQLPPNALLTRQPGPFRLRARTICGDVAVTAVVEGVVLPDGPAQGPSGR